MISLEEPQFLRVSFPMLAIFGAYFRLFQSLLLFGILIVVGAQNVAAFFLTHPSVVALRGGYRFSSLVSRGFSRGAVRNTDHGEDMCYSCNLLPMISFAGQRLLQPRSVGLRGGQSTADAAAVERAQHGSSETFPGLVVEAR